MVSNETAATDFPSYSRVHVAVQFHTHQCCKRLVPGRLDGPLHVSSVATHHISQLKSFSKLRKVPQGKVGYNGMWGKKKSLQGKSFSFQYWRDTVKMKEIVPTHCGCNRSLHVALLFTCEEESRNRIHVQRSAGLRSAEESYRSFQVRKRSTEPRMEMSRAEADSIDYQTALKRYYVSFYYLRITAPESFW